MTGRDLLAIVLLRDVPFWTQSIGRRFTRGMLLLAYLYVGVLLVLLALENFFLFPGARDKSWIELNERYNIHAVEFTSEDGNTIHAFWSAPKEWKPAQGAVLYSHGNGGNISGRQESLLRWQRELNRAVLLYDYPGYGKSTGKPTEASCYAAAEAAFRWLVETQGVPPEEIILLGSSLGGVMAIDLATRHPCRAVVCCAAFTTFPDMAQRQFPWLPARWLVRNRMDNLAKIGTLHCPVFLIHGTADTLVPPWMSERLYEAARGEKELLLLPGHPHRPPSQPEAFAALRRFLQRTASSN